MALKDLTVRKIKEEIVDDPENRGYAGKTNTQIKKLLNEPYLVDRIIKDFKPARIHEILIGIAGTPNVIDIDDVTDAKNL